MSNDIFSAEELTPIEADERAHHESVVDNTIQGIHALARIGDQSLKILRDKRLYRSTHKTWADYVEARFGITHNYANKQIVFGGIIENLGTMVPKNLLPQSERQARPLSKIPPEHQAGVWQAALDASPKDDQGKPQPTGAIVNDEVEKWKQAALESAKEAKGLKQQVMELTEDYETLREREQRARQELANRPTTAKVVEKVVEVEKIVTRAPADYEQLQRKAAKLDELRNDLAAANQALVNLKAEQARKIEEGTRQALRQSQAEVTEFERRKTELERMIEARRRELMEFDSDRTANADMAAALGEFALAVGGLSARLSSFEIQVMHPKTRGELDRVDYLLVECLELVTKLRQVPLYDPASDASVVTQEAA